MGEITYEDVFAILPFNNTIDRVTMPGDEIHQILEGAVSDLCPNMSCSAESFLQISGIKITVLGKTARRHFESEIQGVLS